MFLFVQVRVTVAMRMFVADERLIVEGAGAVGLAAVLSGKIDVAGRHVGIVISGGNVAYTTLRKVLAEEENIG